MTYPSLAQFTSPFRKQENKVDRDTEESYFVDMLLLYMAVSVLFGSSAGIEIEEVCYGRNLRLPFAYGPPLFRGQLYFIPSNGEPRKLLMDDGEGKDPRMKVSSGVVQFKDVTKRDDGMFSISLNGKQIHNIIRLKVLDCASEIYKYYGDMYNWDVPRQAEFLEFSPRHNVDQTKVLWNRTDPRSNKGGRGQMKRNSWEFVRLTQEDNGFYNLRKKDNTLLSRIQLIVEEHNIRYNTKVSERLFIRAPFAVAPMTVTFSTDGDMEERSLMIAGNLVTEDDWDERPFSGRIQVMHDGMEIDPVESTDSGTLKFRDPQNNLAQIVEVNVEPKLASTFVYILVIVGNVFMGIVCCCCVRKCCCKKSSSKRDAPAVHYRDDNQPAGPSHCAAPTTERSYRPMNPHVSREPATTSPGPSVNNPVNIHVNPPKSELAAPGGNRAAPAPSLGSDCLSTGPDPKFELKGLSFPSAPPLSSGSGFCDVYTSDKLNFL